MPLRNDWYWQPENPELETFIQQRQPTSEQMEQSDAFVLVSPEWSGMAAPAVKNFLLYVKQEMANKPCLLVSVSSGRGGRYPIAELRMSSYKNTQVCYIPQHIIVDHVKDRLNEVPVHEQNKEDIYIRERIAYSLQMLQQYAI
ncbi:MAG: NAD(P)H-dependent oxidoreductase [Candidatus Peribacteria bacterium]|nr:MAG: NAD(P)H-dependent oxidoreductase [Candidatus Peribacteria bacterium]